MQVGEIAATSTGDEDFLADFFRTIEDDDAASTLAGFDGAHQSSGAGAQNDGIEIRGW